MSLSPATRLWLWVSLLLTLGLAGIYGILQLPILSVPLLISFAWFYVLEPLITKWESRGRSRGSAIVIMGAVFLFLAVIGGINAPSWARQQARMIQEKAPATIEKAKSAVSSLERSLSQQMPFLGEVKLLGATEQGSAYFKEHVLPAIPGVVMQLLIGVSLIPIITGFLLVDGRSARKRLLEAVPNRHFEMALNIFYRMDQQVGSYLRGVIVEAFLTGLVAFISLTLLGVPGAIVMGSTVMVMNIIPYFGPVVSFTVAILYCLLTGHNELIGMAVLGVGIGQAVDEFLIRPMIIGHAVNIHALVVILLLLLAGKTFGIIGLVIAIPLWAVVRVVLQETIVAVRAYGRYMVD